MPKIKHGEKTIYVALPDDALSYAQNTIKGRWIEAEPFIAKDGWVSYYYAKNVIKGRWEAGEKAIMRGTQIAELYAKEFNLKYNQEFREKRKANGNKS